MSGLVGAPLPPPHQQSLVVSEPQPKPLHLRGVTFGFSKPLQLKKKTVEGGQRTSHCLRFQVRMLEKCPPCAASLSEAGASHPEKACGGPSQPAGRGVQRVTMAFGPSPRCPALLQAGGAPFS